MSSILGPEVLRALGIKSQDSDVEIRRKFEFYWIQLSDAKPVLRERDEITLTKENFCKAMLNAFMEGAKR